MHALHITHERVLHLHVRSFHLPSLSQTRGTAASPIKMTESLGFTQRPLTPCEDVQSRFWKVVANWPCCTKVARTRRTAQVDNAVAGRKMPYVDAACWSYPLWVGVEEGRSK